MNQADKFQDLCQKCKIKPSIGFIGGGNMAQALISGFISSNLTTAQKIKVADPSETIRQNLQEMQLQSFASTPDLFLDENSPSSGIVFLAIKPGSVPELFKSLEGASVKSAPGLFVSVCAGVPLKLLDDLIGPIFGKVATVRVMPNTPALVGQGASAFALGQFATEEHGKLVSLMLSTVGTCDQVPEHLIDAVTGLSASGPAYVYTMIDALSDGGVKVGLPRDLSTKLAVQTVLGSALMMQKTGKSASEMKNLVCSPGGTTIAGVFALEERKVRAAFMAAVEAATERAHQLGEPTHKK